MNLLIHPDLAATAQAIMEGMEGKAIVNPDQTAAWRETQRRREARLRGEDPSSQTQTTFFTVPAPPVSVRWGIEWRWNLTMLLARMSLAELSRFAGDNPWQCHRNPANHEITTMPGAIAIREALALDFPGKEFRVTAVKWREVTEPTML